MLNSKFPKFLFWGKELICFYNDAYRPVLGNNGKHPNALGQFGIDVWPETWESHIKPITTRILAGGKATWEEDQLVPIYRNGRLEDVYWTYSFSPIIGESGQVAGVLVTCTETTDKVSNLKKLAESKDQLHFAVEATELATWDHNPVTNKLKVNDRLKEWFGLPAQKEIELPMALKVIADKDRKRVEKAIATALDFSSGGRYDIEYTIVHEYTKRERIVRVLGRAWFR